MEQNLAFGLKHVYMVLLYIMLLDIMLEKKVNSNINALSKLIIYHDDRYIRLRIIHLGT